MGEVLIDHNIIGVFDLYAGGIAGEFEVVGAS